MAWPEMMGGGYHYMKLEGAFINDSSFYNTHTGVQWEWIFHSQNQLTLMD